MKGLWLLYIVIGLGAFFLSYALEGFVFSNITGYVFISFAAAGVFESAKIMTIIIHRFLSTQKRKPIPPSVAVLTWLFKAGLFFLSILCSLTLLSGFLEAPNMKSVRGEERERIEEHYRQSSARFERERNGAREDVMSRITQKYKTKRETLDNFYEQRILEATRARDREFDRKINGVRKGEFWYEYDRRRSELLKEHEERLADLEKAERSETDSAIHGAEKIYDDKTAAIEKDRKTALAALSSSSFLQDDRLKNQMVSSMLKTLRTGLQIEVKYMEFIAVFSLLITILLEAAIYVIFNYLIISRGDIFALREDLEMEKEMIRLKTDGKLTEEEMGFKGIKKRVMARMKDIKSTLAGMGPKVSNKTEARIYDLADKDHKKGDTSWTPKRAK